MIKEKLKCKSTLSDETMVWRKFFKSEIPLSKPYTPSKTNSPSNLNDVRNFDTLTDWKRKKKEKKCRINMNIHFEKTSGEKN